MMRYTAISIGRPWTLLLIAFAGYCIFLLVLYLWQEKLLYFPDTASRAAVEARAKAHRFRIWPGNGPDYHGLVPEESTGTAPGVILLFHGNAGSALDRVFYGRDLAHLGFRLILLEYPGYGARPGALGEASLVSGAVEAAVAAIGQFGGTLFLVGESLGCGVASAVAGSGKVPVDGIVLITPWDTLPDTAQSVFWYLPARWMARDRYDNARNLRPYDGPVAVAVAENDEVIPPRRGLRLFELLPNRKRLWVFPGANHNTWHAAADSGWWREVFAFLAEGNGPGNGTRLPNDRVPQQDREDDHGGRHTRGTTNP